MRLNFSTKAGIVMAALGILAMYAGFSLIFQAPDDFMNDLLWGETNGIETDFGIGSCFGGLILIGIGIGTLISSLVSIIAGGVTSVSVSSPNEVVIECPHCKSSIEMPLNASGLFDCPHCDQEFQWN